MLSVFWGFVTGLLSGFFGIGGSIISTPALRLAMKTSAEIALGTPLPVIIPTAVVAGYNYAKAKLVDTKLICYSLPSGIAGSVIGSYATKYIDARYLMIVTALILIFFGFKFIKTSTKVFLSHFSKTKAILIGLFAGLVSGLLGVGGGIILIPGFHLILGVPIKVAMGSSLIIIALMAIPGSLVHYFLGHIDITLFIGLTLGVIPASRLSSSFAISAKSAPLKTAFGIFLLIVGIFFILYELKELNIF